MLPHRHAPERRLVFQLFHQFSRHEQLHVRLRLAELFEVVAFQNALVVLGQHTPLAFGHHIACGFVFHAEQDVVVEHQRHRAARLEDVQSVLLHQLYAIILLGHGVDQFCQFVGIVNGGHHSHSFRFKVFHEDEHGLAQVNARFGRVFKDFFQFLLRFNGQALSSELRREFVRQLFAVRRLRFFRNLLHIHAHH